MNNEIREYLTKVKSAKIEMESVLTHIDELAAALVSGDDNKAQESVRKIEQHFSPHYRSLMFGWPYFPEKGDEDEE